MKNPRINVVFDEETFIAIKNFAAKNGTTSSAVVREWALQGLSGKLNVENISMITSIIRSELSNVLRPSVERLATLAAKTCVQASAAAYLSAEALQEFVPANRTREFHEAYEAARKKGVEYTRRTTDLEN